MSEVWTEDTTSSIPVHVQLQPLLLRHPVSKVFHTPPALLQTRPVVRPLHPPLHHHASPRLTPPVTGRAIHPRPVSRPMRDDLLQRVKWIDDSCQQSTVLVPSFLLELSREIRRLAREPKTPIAMTTVNLAGKFPTLLHPLPQPSLVPLLSLVHAALISHPRRKVAQTGLGEHPFSTLIR